MSYTPKTYQDIFLDYLTKAYANGLLGSDANFINYVTKSNQNIENTIVIELSIHALKLAEFYDQLTIVYNEQNMQLSNYEGLKIIGQMYFDPLPADYARTELTLGVIVPKLVNITIPSGTGFQSKSNSELIFYSIDTVTLLAGQSWIKLNVKANLIGPMGNAAETDIDSFVANTTQIDTVTNIYGATGGRNYETMDEYRSRLLRWKYIIPKGTYDAYVNALDSVSVLSSYYIEQYWDGYGSTRIIVDPPIDLVLQAAGMAVNSVKAVDEDILIIPVETISIDISAVINISIDQIVPQSAVTKEHIKILVKQVLKTYIDGGFRIDGTQKKDLGTGTDFIPFKAGMYIASQIPEVEDISFTHPSKPITIQSHERALAGNITVVVV